MKIGVFIAAVAASPRFPYWAAAVSVILCLPSLWMGLFADDYMQRAVFLQPPVFEGMFGTPFADMFTFADGNPDRMRILVDRGLFPWETYSEVVFRFFRPVTVATHWLDYRLWPNSAAMMHVHNLAWLAAAVCVAGFLYRRLLGRGAVAGAAAFVFAVDDSHAWPAAWIANRNELIAILLALVVLGCYMQGRKRRDARYIVLGAALYAVALFAKESSVAVCGYLFAYALFLDGRASTGRWSSLAPFAVVTAAWRLVYVQLGYGAHGSDGYIDPVSSPIQFIQAALVRGPLLVQGLWAFPPSDIYTLGPPVLGPFLVASGAVVVMSVIFILAPLLRRDRVARFFCLGMAVSLVPVCAAGPQDRLLMFASFGSAGLIAQWLAAVRCGALFADGSRFARSVRRAGSAFLISIHFVLAPVALFSGILALDFAGDLMVNMIGEAVPATSDIEAKTAILTNLGNYPGATYLYIVRGLDGQPAPAHARSLAPALMSAVPTTLTRMDEFTIRAEPDGGFPWSLFRGQKYGLRMGETVPLTGMTAKVVSLNDSGWPAAVDFRFDRPLDDPSMLWYRAENTRLVRMTPPGLGERLKISPYSAGTRESAETP